MICLDIAGGDPLRAKEIFDQVDAEWWRRTLAYRKAHADAAKHKA